MGVFTKENRVVDRRASLRTQHPLDDQPEHRRMRLRLSGSTFLIGYSVLDVGLDL